LIEGETLRVRLERGVLPLREALTIAAQAATALCAVHKAGIVHRDVKPENIMIRADGFVKLLDFGLAKLLEAGTAGSLTESGLVVGTHRYMSPEQLRGAQVDARSDLWSLGVVLCEMACGRVVFSANEVPAGGAGAPPWPAVVQKALQQEPGQRFQTADEMLADLRRLSQPIDPAATARRIRRLVAGALALLLLAAGVRVSSTIFRTAGTLRKSMVTITGNVATGAISPDGRYVAYVVAKAFRESIWIRHFDPPSEEELTPLEATLHTRLTFSPDSKVIYYSTHTTVRDFLTDGSLYRLRVEGGTPEHVIDHVDSPVAFNADGTRVAFVRNLRNSWGGLINQLVVAHTDAADEQIVSQGTMGDRSYSTDGCDWTRNGQSILCPAEVFFPSGRLMNVIEVSIATGAERQVLARPQYRIGRLVRTTDDDNFIVTVAKGEVLPPQLVEVNRSTGEMHAITGDQMEYSSPTVTNRGSKVLALQRQSISYIGISSIISPCCERRITSDSGPYEGIHWTADDHLLTSRSYVMDSEIWQLALDGGWRKRLARVNIGQNAIACGKSLVVSSLRDGHTNIWRADADSNKWSRLSFGPGPDVEPQCSADGRTLIYQGPSNGQPVIWKVNPEGGDPVQLTRTYSKSPAISPDGKRFACRINTGRPDFESRVAVFPIEGGEPSQVLSGIPGSLLRWSVDGAGLTYVVTRAGVSNIWRRNISAGPPVQLSHFDDGHGISSFDWSRDGTEVACVRGFVASDLVLLERSPRHWFWP
jgi:serine/threonine protein kinase